MGEEAVTGDVAVGAAGGVGLGSQEVGTKEGRRHGLQ